MGKLIHLNRYRKDQKRHYLSRHSHQLDEFIATFLDRYMPCDFIRIANAYQDYRRDNAELAWDYIEFREMLKETIADSLAYALTAEQTPRWLDPRYISVDDIVERCISNYVFGSTGQ